MHSSAQDHDRTAMLDVAAKGNTLTSTLPRWAGIPVGVVGAVAVSSGLLLNPQPGSGAAIATCLSFALGVLACAVSVLLLIGSFATAPSQIIASRASARTLLPGALQFVGSVVALTMVIHRAAAGTIGWQRAVMAMATPAIFAVAVHGIGRLLVAIGTSEEPATKGRPSVFRAWGFWLVILMALLYLPMLGNFTLIDPWESEYAEVARSMLSRRDWISLWWGDQGWFFSKPILDFAIMAASLAWFGVDHRPDQLIASIGNGQLPQPEWAVRFPIFVLSLVSVYVLYRGTANALGRRAAFFGGLILITTPYWFFLTRQVMTDMVYMAPLGAALGFMIVAIRADAGAQVPSYELRLGSRAVALSTYHLLLLVVLGLGLAQIFYLLSRHVSLDLTGQLFSLHRDQVFQGSPGNCDLPGNAVCMPDKAANGAAFQPVEAAILWAIALGAFVWRTRNERDVKALSYLAMWSCVGLAFLGKAAPGFVLPVCTLVALLIALGRPRELMSCQWLNAALLFAAVVAPWFVQEYARHGDAFFERLFMHDMYQRAFGHVHDTNAGDDTSFRYYVWQLGYGLFPWSGVIAAGALWCLGRSTLGPDRAGEGERVATFTFTLWLLATFGLFSIAGTKFHHYIAPLVPAAAMLGGAVVDALWRTGKHQPIGTVGLIAGLIIVLITRDLATTNAVNVGPARLLQLFTYLYARPWPTELQFEWQLASIGALAALGGFGLLARKWRRGAIITVTAAAVICSAWCMSVYLPAVAPHWGQRETIAEYYRQRRSPEELLVAYAQNWMGENFYTGNHVATFKVPGSRFKNWVEQQRNAGSKRLFVTTEHKTIPRLKQDLGVVESFEILTTSELNNKFALARVTL